MTYSQRMRILPVVVGFGVVTAITMVVGGIIASATGIIPDGGEVVAKDFMHAITTGDSDKARELICPIEGGGPIIVVAAKMRWSDYGYESNLESDDSDGQVRVRGRVEMNAGDFEALMNDLMVFINQYGSTYVSIPGSEELPDLDISISGALDIDFDMFNVRKYNNRWCVDYGTLFNFYYYLIELASRTFQVQLQ
jgi:hypothetical protein